MALTFWNPAGHCRPSRLFGQYTWPKARGGAAVELKFGLDETELELPRLRPADRHLSSDRRRGDRGENPDVAHVPIAAEALGG